MIQTRPRVSRTFCRSQGEVCYEYCYNDGLGAVWESITVFTLCEKVKFVIICFMISVARGEQLLAD